MTPGTAIVTVSVDMAEAATTNAGLLGMMTGAMMTGVTMSAVMTSGDTKLSEGRVGGMPGSSSFV